MLSAAPSLLASCPNPSMTANPLDTPGTRPRVVSVCYAPLVTDLETEVRPLAVTACANRGSPTQDPRPWKRTFFLNNCPLFKAMRIAYYCENGADEALPAGPSHPLTGNQGK
jgi:hypothetical protein